MSAPVLGAIRRVAGVAGQVAYTVTATYPGEPPASVAFVGSVYGTPGPVVMASDAWPGGVVVTDPGRFGDNLSAAWVRRYFTR